MKYPIRRTVNGQYYARIVASNGQTLFTSETYVSKADAIAAANLVKIQGAGGIIIDET